MSEKGVVGKDITPYMLGRVAELTDGESLESNIKLVENNARVGAGVAKAVREVRREREGRD